MSDNLKARLQRSSRAFLFTFAQRQTVTTPEISRFFGIIIFMYAKAHLPHFHAEYNEDEAMFSIETGEIIKGSLPKKPTRLVQAWVELHRDELIENYNLLQQEVGSFKKIKPLE